MKNLLKEYIKSIINESSYGISPADEANAIFGNTDSTAKEVYYQLIELDNFFYQFDQKYKKADDFVADPPPQKILNNLMHAFGDPSRITNFEGEMYNLYGEMKKRLSSKITMSIYKHYIYSLPQISRSGTDGSSRSAFKIGNNFVLKLSLDKILNEPFLDNQNKIESNPELQKILNPFVPIVYTKSKRSPSQFMNNKDGTHWIIVEECNVINKYSDDDQISWLQSAKIKSYNPEKDNTYIEGDYIKRWANLLYYHIIKNTPEEKIKKDNERIKYVNHDYGAENYADDIGFDANNLSQLEMKIIEAHQRGFFNMKDINSRNVGYGSDGRPVILDTGLLAKRN
jgi:hypothetical protein